MKRLRCLCADTVSLLGPAAVVFALAIPVCEVRAASTGGTLGEVTFGFSPTYFQYTETLTAPLKSSETATFSSVFVSGRLYFLSASSLRAKYEMVNDVPSRYEGTSLDGSSEIVTRNPLQFRTWQLDLYLGLIDDYSVFASYGSRYWDRFLSSGQGYREIYEWNFMALGIARRLYEAGPLRVDLEGSLRPIFNGQIRVITSETVTGGEDSKMRLGLKTGFRLSVDVRYEEGPGFVLITPWAERSELGESDVVPNATLAPTPGTGIQEPASRTNQVGVDVGFGLSF